MFEDKRNSKKYIGQSKNSLKKRYKNTARNDTYFSTVLKKHGWNNFHITLLKYNLQTFDEMDYWENFYIKEYNSLSPNGYNLTGGGNTNHSWTEEAKEKASKNRFNAKKFKIKNVHTGEIIECKNISRFCKEHRLDRSDFNKVLRGKNYIVISGPYQKQKQK